MEVLVLALCLYFDDYASYNFTGGVGVVELEQRRLLWALMAQLTPSGKIGSGQSFFTTSIASGKQHLTIICVGWINETGQYSVFLKRSNTKAVEVFKTEFG
jgi:hypothetical protein